MDIRELASILQSGAFTRQQAEALLKLVEALVAEVQRLQAAIDSHHPAD